MTQLPLTDQSMIQLTAEEETQKKELLIQGKWEWTKEMGIRFLRYHQERMPSGYKTLTKENISKLQINLILIEQDCKTEHRVIKTDYSVYYGHHIDTFKRREMWDRIMEDMQTKLNKLPPPAAYYKNAKIDTWSINFIFNDYTV